MRDLLKRMTCWLIGHRYQVRQVFTPETRHVFCLHCAGSWAMNDRIRVITPWNEEFAQFYRERGFTINKD
jgi:hypothetical protein